MRRRIKQDETCRVLDPFRHHYFFGRLADSRGTWYQTRGDHVPSDDKLTFEVEEHDGTVVCHDDAAWERYQRALDELNSAERALFLVSVQEPWSEEERETAETSARLYLRDFEAWIRKVDE